MANMVKFRKDEDDVMQPLYAPIGAKKLAQSTPVITQTTSAAALPLPPFPGRGPTEQQAVETALSGSPMTAGVFRQRGEPAAQSVPRLGLGVSPALRPDQEASMAANQGIRGGQQVLGGPRIIARPGQTTLLTNQRVEDITDGGNFIQLGGGLRQGVGPSEDLAARYGGERSLFVQGPEGQPVLRNVPERGFLNLDTFRAQNAYKEPTLSDLLSGAAQRSNAPATGTPREILSQKIQNAEAMGTIGGAVAANRYRKQLSNLGKSERAERSIQVQEGQLEVTQAKLLKELQKPPAESKFEWSTGGVDFSGNPIKPSFSVGKTKIDLDPAEAAAIDKTARQNFANWRALNPDVTDPVELEKELKKFLQRATFDNYGQMIEAQTPEG